MGLKLPPTPVTESFQDKRLCFGQYPARDGVYMRLEDGVRRTNVPHLVMLHSPTGFWWGDAGPGARDLALNIVEYYGRRHGLLRGRRELPAREGMISRRKVLEISEVFLYAYVVEIRPEGGFIPASHISDFLFYHLYERCG